MFWDSIKELVRLADDVLAFEARPMCPYDFPEAIMEVWRVWEMMQYFQRNSFNPTDGDEIMVRHPTWLAHNGTHRAAVLSVLDLPVPAILVDEWKDHRIRYHWRVTLPGQDGKERRTFD